MLTSDLDELENLEEQQEIEIFLAEIRSSEVNAYSMSLSTHARREYIANVLISQVRNCYYYFQTGTVLSIHHLSESSFPEIARPRQGRYYRERRRKVSERPTFSIPRGRRHGAKWHG